MTPTEKTIERVKEQSPHLKGKVFWMAVAYRHPKTEGDFELNFLINVIATACTKPSAKLKGLLKLIDGGSHVSTIQFDMFTISVDGDRHPISFLEEVK